MATLATPGTPSSLGLIVNWARTDMSMGDTVVERSPIISNRLVDETACSICGGFETRGSSVVRVRRSCTSCRAVKMLVPRWNVNTTDESPSTDVEWTLDTNGIPL